MARPAFQPTEEIKIIVHTGSEMGQTWDEIEYMVCQHLQERREGVLGQIQALSLSTSEDAAERVERLKAMLKKMPASVSVRTLQKYYSEDFKEGGKKLEAKLAGKLMKLALIEEHPASIFFALKTRYKWSETSKHEVTGKDGEELKTNTTLDLTPDMAAAIAASLQKEY